MQDDDGLEVDDSLQTVEQRALHEFGTQETGGWECRRILNDWFIRLRERTGADNAQYRRDIWDAVDVLRDIHAAIKPLDYIDDERKERNVWPRLWVWPSGEAIRKPPKHWINRSPVSVDSLDAAMAQYLKRPWLQHDIIDASVINALLFTELVEFREQMKIGAITGSPNWSYVFSDGNELAELGLNLALSAVGFVARWLMLPAIAAALLVYGFETGALIVIGLWALYVLYRLILIPARWRLRKARREAALKAEEMLRAMLNAWWAARGSTINPSRLKELVVAAEQRNAVFRPVLYTLIDRAIHRDPTALVTE